jgi:oxygen-dependent protoporphyrinogen oxidase
VSNQNKSVVVIGSGIAGLTAAYRLQQKGFEVTVLEGSNQPGGRMANVQKGSFYAYTGATGLFQFYKDMWKLFAELNLTDKLIAYPTMGQGIAVNNQGRHNLDFNRTVSMLWQPALSLLSRLKLATLIPDFIRARVSVDPCLLHTAAHLDDESMSDYLERKVGRDFIENIVGNVYRNLWAWNIDDMSRAYFLSIYAHVRGEPSYQLEGGIGLLTRTLAGKVTIKYNSHVHEISRTGESLKRKVRYQTDDGEEVIEADIVVCAVEGNKVEKLVPDMAPYEKDFFGNVPYAQYAMVQYILKNIKKAYSVRTFFSRDQKNPISFAATFEGNPNVAGNPPRLWVVLAPDRANHYIGHDGQDLEKVVRRFVKEIYPLEDEDVLEAHDMYKNYTIAAFPTGQLKKVKKFLDSQESGPKNIYYVGDYLSNATTGGACASGERTAGIIAKHWQ